MPSRNCEKCNDVPLFAHESTDPVSEFEANRNNYCASITGLRNPFIDHPKFAEMIWG